MSNTLYRKYRPKNFNEVIGQAHIVRTLSNAIKNNRIGQAYLFTGPRGTGKTSIARIFAKAINCPKLKSAISCEKCPACDIINSGKSLDIIEIDAASNTGVDNIRELRETIALAPSVLKYKVYIIDEVHMLSAGAFNALLKVLEEPPAHVVFILATTEIHKVPETILSRVQRFDFARLPLSNIIEKLSLIAKAEKIKIEKDALEMIALSAEGGMRDAESILEQIIALEDRNITAKEVEEILGTTDRQIAAKVAALIVEKNSAKAISEINKLMEKGFDLQIFNKTLINYFRQLMLLKISPELKKYFTYEITQEELEKMLKLSEISELTQIVSAINFFLEAQNKIASFILPQLPLEIAVIKSTGVIPKALAFEHSNQTKNFEPKPPLSSSLSFTSKTEKKTVQTDLYSVKSNWNKLLNDIQPYNHSLKALLLNCQPTDVKDNEITIGTPYEFYKEKLNESGNKLTVEEVLGRILECEIFIKVVVDKNLAAKKETFKNIPMKDKEQDSLLNSALEIMGGKIVEE